MNFNLLVYDLLFIGHLGAHIFWGIVNLLCIV